MNLKKNAKPSLFIALFAGQIIIGVSAGIYLAALIMERCVQL